MKINLTRRGDEVECVLSKGYELNNFRNQARGSYLITASYFLEWATVANSEWLFVNGNDDGERCQPISAMTLACANFIEYFKKYNTNAGVIRFFCGLHLKPSTQNRGPRGLLKCLIAQLLINYPEAMPNIDLEAWMKLRERGSSCDLCTILRDIVRKLPERAVVYCIIDGLQFFKEPEWELRTQLIMKEITRLTRDPAVRAAFKVLLTSPVSCRYISEQIHGGTRCALPVSIDPRKTHHTLSPEYVKYKIEAYVYKYKLVNSDTASGSRERQQRRIDSRQCLRYG